MTLSQRNLAEWSNLRGSPRILKTMGPVCFVLCFQSALECPSAPTTIVRNLYISEQALAASRSGPVRTTPDPRS